MTDTTADARNRAWRTFVQGLLIDVVAAVVLAIAPALVGADFAFTGEYWAALGVLAAKTAVASVVSYVARRVVPPPA
jgi:Kef-type K+ transport system membrane component KefB